MRQARHADLARCADDAELEALLVVVVHPVLGVDDPDVDIEGSGEQFELADREAHHPFGLHRKGDAIDEGVRPKHADAVLAVEVHPEHRVAHAPRIAVTDLDRGRLRRFENDAIGPVGPEHARAGDLDLLRPPARPDLATRGALALLLLADFLVMRVDDVVRYALRGKDAVVEPDRALAETRNRAEIVRDEHNRLLRCAELADLREALVLEVLVTDRQHFVHQENVRLQVHGDRETETHIHAARVGLHRRIEEAADIGELLDGRHRAVHLLARETEERAIEVCVLAAAKVRVESRADLKKRGDATVHLERSPRGLRRTREELEQGRLPRPVRANDAERRARLDREADVAEGLHHLGRRVLPQDRLLERAAPLAAKLVGLRNVIGADRAHLRAMTAEISAPKRSSFSTRMFAASFGSATSSARLVPAARRVRTSGFANPASSTMSAYRLGGTGRRAPGSCHTSWAPIRS